MGVGTNRGSTGSLPSQGVLNERRCLMPVVPPTPASTGNHYDYVTGVGL